VNQITDDVSSDVTTHGGNKNGKEACKKEKDDQAKREEKDRKARKEKSSTTSSLTISLC
jgi:hypothetical protein